MQIFWKGQSCFQLVTSLAKSNINIVIDPFGPDNGLRVPSFQADILLITHDHDDHNNKKAVAGNPIVIESPGEYEVKDVYIEGIPSWHDNAEGKERGANTIYLLEAEDLRICHLGDLGQKELTQEQLQKIGEVDVLMVPVGGGPTISCQEAVKIISQIEPKIIIPMHYSLPKLKINLDGVDKFLKSLGIKSLNPEPKLNVKKKDLIPEEAKVVLLQA